MIDGKLHEPFERLSVDVPDRVTSARSPSCSRRRKGELIQMMHGESRVRMEFRVPVRGLIGFRTEFLTITRGAGIANHVFDGYGPWVGEMRTPPARLADRRPRRPGHRVRRRPAEPTAASCSSAPAPWSTAAWSSARTPASEDLEINIVREKKLTNMRSRRATC